MINGTLFTLKGLLEVRERTWKMTLLLYATKAVFQRTTKRKKLTHSPYNFPDEMGEFTPGAVEKVAVRADVLIQAKAL